MSHSVLCNQSPPSLFHCTDADIANCVAADRGLCRHKISASLRLLCFNTNDTGPKHMIWEVVVRRRNVAPVTNNGEGSSSVHNEDEAMDFTRSPGKEGDHNVTIEVFRHAAIIAYLKENSQRQRDLPKNTPLDGVEVLDSRHGPSDAMHNPSQPLKVGKTLFQNSRRFTHFYQLSHSELVDIEKVALSSSL
nr:hypothetical protein [Tanacetum cinerariifolium]